MNKNKLTEFEWKVLKTTAKIPIGETRSYKWVAENVGRPKAMRAVGQALSKNPLAPLIPCHRVVGSSGKLTGYAGGLKAKQQLLNMEKEVAEFLRAHGMASKIK